MADPAGDWLLAGVEAYDGSTFFDAIYRTEDGINFTRVTDLTGYGGRLAGDGKGLWVLSTGPSNDGDYNPVIWHSTNDGRNWTAHEPQGVGALSDFFNSPGGKLSYIAGVWCYYVESSDPDHAADVYTSPDAITWTKSGFIPAAIGPEFQYVLVIRPVGDGFYAYLGGFGGTSGAYVSKSPDGVAWSVPALIVENAWSLLDLFQAGETVYAYLAMVTDTGSIFTQVYRERSDGSWSYVTSPSGVNSISSAVLPYGESFVAQNGIFSEDSPPGMRYSSDGVTWSAGVPAPDGVNNRMALGVVIQAGLDTLGGDVYAIAHAAPTHHGPSVGSDFSDPTDIVLDTDLGARLDIHPLSRRLEVMYRDATPEASTFGITGIQTFNVMKFDVQATLGSDYGVYGHSIWYGAGMSEFPVTDAATGEVFGANFFTAVVNAGYRWDDSGKLARWTATHVIRVYGVDDPYTGPSFRLLPVGTWTTVGTFPSLAQTAGPNLLSAAQRDLVISNTDGWKLVDASDPLITSLSSIYGNFYALDPSAGSNTGTTTLANTPHTAEFDPTSPHDALYVNTTSTVNMTSLVRSVGTFPVTAGQSYTMFLYARIALRSASTTTYLPNLDVSLLWFNASGGVLSASDFIHRRTVATYIDLATDLSDTVVAPPGAVSACMVIRSNAAYIMDRLTVYGGPIVPCKTTVRIKFDALTGVHDVYYDGVWQGSATELSPQVIEGNDVAGVNITRVAPSFDVAYPFAPYGSPGYYAVQPSYIDDVLIREVNDPWAAARSSSGVGWTQVPSALNYIVSGRRGTAYIIGASGQKLGVVGGPPRVHFW